MATKIVIEHNGAAWEKIFKSPAMYALVDEVGERIAEEAGSEHYAYMRTKGIQHTAAGAVVADQYTGSIQEATDKRLTKAVHK